MKGEFHTVGYRNAVLNCIWTKPHPTNCMTTLKNLWGKLVGQGSNPLISGVEVASGCPAELGR